MRRWPINRAASAAFSTRWTAWRRATSPTFTALTSHAGTSHYRQLARDPLFFNIYQDTAYEAGAHWALLTEFMHFRFDELMFSFSESDCGNPTLMAHIRGLRAETLLQRSYAEGIREYALCARPDGAEGLSAAAD